MSVSDRISTGTWLCTKGTKRNDQQTNTFRVNWGTDSQASTYVTTSLGLEFLRKICTAKKCQHKSTTAQQVYELQIKISIIINYYIY
jgi:hypothetical protein